MTRTVLDNKEFLVEDAEGVSFDVTGNTAHLKLARRLTEKRTGRIFYVDRDSFQVFEAADGGLSKITDAALLQKLDAQRR
jgi:hypothetical protein